MNETDRITALENQVAEMQAKLNDVYGSAMRRDEFTAIMENFQVFALRSGYSVETLRAIQDFMNTMDDYFEGQP